jgi:hypothetical protein
LIFYQYKINKIKNKYPKESELLLKKEATILRQISEIEMEIREEVQEKIESELEK